MEDNNNQEVKKEIEKKKGVKVYHIIIVFLVAIIALLGVHIYANNAGYGDIIGLVKGEKKEETASSQKEDKTKKDENDEKDRVKEEEISYDGVYKRTKKDISDDYIVSDNCIYLIIEGNEIYFSANKENKMLEGTFTVNSNDEIEYRLIKDTQDFAFYTAATYKFETIDGKLNIVVDSGNIGKIYYEKIESDDQTNNESDVNNKQNSNTETNETYSNAEIKESFENYLKLRESMSGTNGYALVKMGLMNAEDDKMSSEKYTKTNVKYDDFKSKMLEYMTEEWFNERFSNIYVNQDGYVAYLSGGMTGVEYELGEIRLKGGYSKEVYIGDVYTVNIDGSKELSNVEFHFEKNNGKIVISYSDI